MGADKVTPIRQGVDMSTSLAGSGEPPHDGGMEDLLRRVGNLEQSGTQIRERLSTIEERLSHTATKAWVMGGAIVVLIAILGGFWWMAQQYLGPILQHLPH